MKLVIEATPQGDLPIGLDRPLQEISGQEFLERVGLVRRVFSDLFADGLEDTSGAIIPFDASVVLSAEKVYEGTIPVQGSREVKWHLKIHIEKE